MWQVFKELFDAAIHDRHDGYGPDNIHPTDLNQNHLRAVTLDPNYVLSSRVRTGRCIRGFRLPPACSRAERRKVEEVCPPPFNILIQNKQQMTVACFEWEC